MRFVACGLLSAGLLLVAGQGVSRADDAPAPGNAAVTTMQFNGGAQTQLVWRRGCCGCYGGGGYYGGYGGYAGYGGYGGYASYYPSYGYGSGCYSGYGYGGYGGGYGSYGGYGGGYGGYGYGYPSTYSYGYGSYPYSGYGYGSGYGGYGGYGSGYGGYPSTYSYGGYPYSGYGYMSYGAYGRPVSIAQNPSPAPRLTPIDTTPSTYPYNGGPQNPLPMPRTNAPQTQPQKTIPANSLMVSLPTTMSAGVSPIFTPANIPASSRPTSPVPASNRYTYRAYGE
jgi:hypothetical protein